MEETPLEATIKYVEGIDWPADKQTVLDQMENHGAPDDVLQTIRDMDKDRFSGPNEVHNALWMEA